MSEVLYKGPERRRDMRINATKWRLLTIWITALSIGLVWFAHSTRTLSNENKHRITELENQKAAVRSLEKTNCGLKQFLLSARVARLMAAQHETDPALKEADRQAAKSYLILSQKFTAAATGVCD